MRIEAVCFTDRGRELGSRLVATLEAAGERVGLTRCGEDGPTLRQWAEEHFHVSDSLVVIGAAGIAVRAVATLLVSKTSDPAVVAVDECGRFVIPLLSGHIGGANALAKRIASLLGAVAVITTATDLRGVFAVDEWAVRAGMHIRNPERIKNVSAKLLEGKNVVINSAFSVTGMTPAGVVVTDRDPCDVFIGVRGPAPDGALCLAPRVAVLGIGCRRDTAAERIEAAFLSLCDSANLFPEAFDVVCSIDLKRDEPGIIAFCRERGMRFETFGAERLKQVENEMHGSDFVQAVTGVDNVCERSALIGGSTLAVPKTIVDGVAMAVTVRKYTLSFSPVGDMR